MFQEHEGFSTSPVTMPTKMTRKGFPTVHQLDFSSLPGVTTPQADPSSSHFRGRGGGGEGGGGLAKPPKKKKSLFAQQLERHGLGYFGIEVNELSKETTTQAVFKKDFVEPVTLVGGVSSSREMSANEREMVMQSTKGPSFEAGALDNMEVDDGKGVAREEFESGASQTWKRQEPYLLQCYIVVPALHFETWQKGAGANSIICKGTL